MNFRHYLGITDYVVIVLSLLISAVIGVLFRYRDMGQATMKEYLMAGKNMTKFPVILSISVTMTSASTMIATPAEVYKYGAQYVMMAAGTTIGMIFASYVFIPVYFQCGVSTVYEYLEMRFGKLTRHTISAAYIIQMVLYMSAVLYAAVLALSAVTDLSFEMSVISVGVCCAFYCAMGGLKAVLWTDVLQFFLMISCVITVCTAGIIDVGGFSNIFTISNAGKRLNLFNFSLDLTKRYTFWNCLSRGIFLGMAHYGVSQTEVQRMLSMSNADRAKSVLRLSIFPAMFFQVLCVFMGLVLYGLYHSCDPLLNKNQTGLTKYDQLVPFYIVNRIGSIPGLTGLCIAGIFSGSLSTISSALNSLATVTVIDFLKPAFPSFFSEKRIILMAKYLTALYGIICVSCALVLKSVESVKQVLNIFLGLVEGPIVAIFIVAVLTRKASDKCSLFGFLAALPIISWIGFGSLFGRYREPSLPLSTEHCSTDTFNQTYFFQGNSSIPSGDNPTDFRNLMVIYKISFNWLSLLGALLTLFATFLAVIITGWRKNVVPADSKCLSPVTRFWMNKGSAGISTNDEPSNNGWFQHKAGAVVDSDINRVEEKKF